MKLNKQEKRIQKILKELDEKIYQEYGQVAKELPRENFFTNNLSIFLEYIGRIFYRIGNFIMNLSNKI